ncbi:MAG TPA: DUF6152 family protein [Gammaproteobacteria bacterium]
MRNTAASLLLTLVSSVAAAHHANIEHDTSVVGELEGQLMRVSWRNPHVLMTLNVVAEDGSEEIWELEAQDVNSLGRRGLSAELVPEGVTVRVAGHPSRWRNSLYVTNLLLPDGTEIKTRGDAQPRWSSEHIGFDNDPLLADAPIPEIDGSLGIFRVWLRRGRGGFAPNLPLTAAARDAASDHAEADNPNARCIAGGMPAVMTRVSAPHPIDFVARDSEILIRLEVFDVVRTVHMDADTDAGSQPVSRLGYSTGRWEGNTLVVRTSRIDWPYFDPNGRVPLGGRAEILERFTLSDDATTLSYEIVVTDAETFTAPVSARWEFDPRPDLIVEPFECTLGD